MDYEQEDWFPEKKKSSWVNVLLLLLLVAIILVGGYYGLQYVKKMDGFGSKTPEVTIKKMIENGDNEAVINEIKTQLNKKKTKAPSAVVRDFYKWYIEQPGKPTDEFYKNHEAVHPELVNHINQELVKHANDDYDPFICSSSKPSHYEVLPEKITGPFAKVMMNIHFDQITPAEITLKKADDQWKISQIDCLAPEGARGLIENAKKDTNLDYVTTKETSFQWNQITDKSNRRAKLVGYGFKTENAKIKAGLIESFLISKGFKSNADNKNGLEKGDIVCLFSDEENEMGHRNISLMCAKK